MADTQPNMNAPNGAQSPNTARIAVNPLINVQDRLFHTLFFRITLAYARGCPKPLRRIIEMMILVKVINHSKFLPTSQKITSPKNLFDNKLLFF